RSADDGCHIREPNRIAVAIGDNGVGILRGGVDLVVGVDRRGLGWAVEVALRRVDVKVPDRGADVVNVQAVGGKRLRIELYAHRRSIPAADADKPDAVHLRYFLRQSG